MILESLKSRWQAESGYREVWQIAFPLILSTGSWSLQHFIDRMFLTWYSPEAIAASMPASLINWTLTSIFVGTASYVNTFVAQYFGAHKPERIGPSVWQGIYLSALSLFFILLIYPFADDLFRFIGHPEKVQQMETVYFRILLWGAPWVVISGATSGFFSGRGKTWIVMWINVVTTFINIILDYLLIFGKLGFPEMGIAGAGWASVVAVVFSAVMFFALMARRKHNQEFHTLKGWRFQSELFHRLMRYGLPNGIQFMLEVLAFTIFTLLVGKLGVIELAATNIAFNINTLAFMPMFGMSLAVSVLVGQRLGENRPHLAEKATWSGFHLAFSYFSLLAIGYFFAPQIFLYPFKWQASGDDFHQIYLVAATLLRFVAVYSLFDSANMIFSGSLKGAGDTRFVATASIALSWVLMLIPCFLTLYVFKGGLYWLWVFVTLYITGLGFIFYWRFLKGPWRSMRVIESSEGVNI